MTDLRTAAQQALEALEFYYDQHGEESDAKVITALRAALAEPVQEPVAWIQPDHLQKARVAPFLCRVEPTQRCSDFVALYTAPPQRKPLTEEEIDGLFVRSGLGAYHQKDFAVQTEYDRCIERFARALERAHGIGEQQ